MLPVRFVRSTPIALGLASAIFGARAGAMPKLTSGPRPLVVVAEGYDSCQAAAGNPRHEILAGLTTSRLDAMIADVEAAAGVSPHVLFACFGPPETAGPSPWQAVDLRMQDRDDLGSFAVFPFDSPFQQELRSDITHHRLPIALAAWFDLVNSAAQSGQAVYLIGHGYGAWAAMAAVRLTSLTPRLLVTIDAISPLGCGPSEVLGQSPSVPPGCKRPPEDFTTEDYGDIADSSAYWLNVFQTQFTRLHSGAVFGSNYNWILRPLMEIAPTADTPLAPSNDHFALSRDERIWTWIGDTIAADYSAP